MFRSFRVSLPKFATTRFYSQAPSGTSVTGKQTKYKFDRSIIKPVLVVTIFGTMLSHVMNQQRLAGEIERRYFLKMEILRELIERARRGESDIDVERELRLVNKLFSRTKEGRALSEKEAESLSQISSSQQYSEAEVLQSMNSSTRALEKESLDDVLKSIMNEVSDEPSVSKSDVQVREPSSGEFITDKDALKKRAEYERELLQYKPSTDAHLIVENPGDLSSAAEDTKVSKFL